MILLQNMKHDFVEGILGRIKLYIGIVILSLAGNFKLLYLCGIANGNQQNLGWQDFLFFILKGSEVIDIKEKPFDFPYIFMTFYILIAFIIGDYIEKDLKKNGINYLIRMHNRTKWIASKYIWCACTVTISYMCIIIISFAFSIINNGNILLKTQFNELLGLNMNYQNVYLIIKLIFLSYLTELAVAAIQVTISLLIDSVFSLIIVIGFWVLSVYWASPILINSYCFIQRTNIFINGTISLSMGLILDIIIIITCVSIGMFYFKRKDILV